MNELDQIKLHTNGELPSGNKTIVRVSNIENPHIVLDNCKRIIQTFLEHESLDKNSSQWRILLPKEVIDFINTLDDNDFMYDELLYPLWSCIEDLQDPNIRSWKWYSSRIIPSGFEIITTDSFLPRFLWMIHCHGIPCAKIWIMDDRFGHYAPGTIKDVTSYK